MAESKRAKGSVKKTQPVERKAEESSRVPEPIVREFARTDLVGWVAGFFRDATKLIPLAQRFLETGIAAHEATIKRMERPPTGMPPAAPPAKVEKSAKQVTFDEAVEKKRVTLKVLQDRLVQVIDDHEEKLRPSLDELGCGGDCYKCPNPEPDKYTGVEAQVRGCLSSVVNALGLDPALLRDPQ